MRAQLLKYVAIGAGCIAIGVAGTAGAGSLITGKAIKDGSIGVKDLSKKARKALAGKAGPRGATGARGTAGTNGTAGAPGSAAPGVVFGALGIASSANLFTPPSGGSGIVSPESGAQAPIPTGATLVAKDFGAHLNAGPGATSVVLTVRVDGADTGMTCTITGSSPSCQATGATVTLSPGALVDLHITASGTLPGATIANWSLRLTP